MSVSLTVGLVPAVNSNLVFRAVLVGVFLVVADAVTVGVRAARPHPGEVLLTVVQGVLVGILLAVLEAILSPCPPSWGPSWTSHAPTWSAGRPCRDRWTAAAAAAGSAPMTRAASRRPARCGALRQADDESWPHGRPSVQPSRPTNGPVERPVVRVPRRNTRASDQRFGTNRIDVGIHVNGLGADPHGTARGRGVPSAPERRFYVQQRIDALWDEAARQRLVRTPAAKPGLRR